MIRFSSALLIALLALPAHGQSPRADGVLRVISYNLHQGKGQKDPSIGGGSIRIFGREVRIPRIDLPIARPGEPGKIADALRRFDADVILLQEVNDRAINSLGQDQARTIADDLGMHVAYAVAQKQGIWGVLKAQGNAVLSRYPISDVRELELNAATDDEERRIAVFARIEHPGVPGGVWAVCTHLPSNRRDLRESDAAKLGEEAARLGGAVIVGGDFNATPDATAMERFADAMARGGKSVVDAWTKGEGDGNTSPAPDARNRIDYIWSSAELTPVSASVPRDVNESDHFMVVANLRMHPPIPQLARRAQAGPGASGSLLGIGAE
jgi:endonuclease/exonuclease/phosphatase family metal-dependent hydrolase